jgi:DNA-directed RNA polymerase subunit H (RpoH/RPB5)
MNPSIEKLLEKLAIRQEFLPIDFFYTETIARTTEEKGKVVEIFIPKYNQSYTKVKNSHRPVSKTLQPSLIL